MYICWNLSFFYRLRYNTHSPVIKEYTKIKWAKKVRNLEQLWNMPHLQCWEFGLSYPDLSQKTLNFKQNGELEASIVNKCFSRTPHKHLIYCEQERRDASMFSFHNSEKLSVCIRSLKTKYWTRVALKMFYAIDIHKPSFTNLIFEVMKIFILPSNTRGLQKCWFLDEDKVDDSF